MYLIRLVVYYQLFQYVGVVPTSLCPVENTSRVSVFFYNIITSPKLVQNVLLIDSVVRLRSLNTRCV